MREIKQEFVIIGMKEREDERMIFILRFEKGMDKYFGYEVENIEEQVAFFGLVVKALGDFRLLIQFGLYLG